MPIQDFLEKDIRNKILNKVQPKITHKSSKHWKGRIFHKGKFIGKVKIPNSHNRIMRENKSQYIATALNLNHDQFNDLINCTLTGPNYYNLMDNFL